MVKNILMKTLFEFNSAKPFLKWAGGKTQLINTIEKNLPKDIKSMKIKKYVEPFIGGGALFFYLQSKYNFEEVYINDFNKDLINVYINIRDDLDKLINELEFLEKKYQSLSLEEKKSFFYEIRSLYNLKSKDNIQNSAFFIFLNKTCFNGLYRVNSSGGFNVPFGEYKNPKILDETNLYNVSKMLQNVNIISGDFEIIENFIDNNTFVYFDPPYRPLTLTASFNTYSNDIFNDDSQKRLARFYQKLDKIGAKLMLSNSDPKNNDENDNFFDDLYSEFNINRVQAKRMINSDSSKRGNISEIIVMNYF